MPINVTTDPIYTTAIKTAARIRACSRWAVNNRPRLCHLALRAKKRRNRVKNLRRIVREFLEEEHHGQE